MAPVEEVLKPLAGPERNVMPLAESAHFPGDGFQSAFHNFFRGAAEAAGEGGFEEFFAMGREGDLHGRRIAGQKTSDDPGS
jgi:hypothetical protein